MAKQEDVELVRQGPRAISASAKEGRGPFDLRGTDLSRVDLQGAVLVGADLRGARLEGTNLSYAILVDADLDGAFRPGRNTRISAVMHYDCRRPRRALEIIGSPLLMVRFNAA